MTEEEWSMFIRLVNVTGDVYEVANGSGGKFLNGFADAMNDVVFTMIGFMATNGVKRTDIENRMVRGGCDPGIAHSYVYD